LRGETSIAELCRKEGITQTMYYGWWSDVTNAFPKTLRGRYPILASEPRN
jgi:hypothetical protein